MISGTDSAAIDSPADTTRSARRSWTSSGTASESSRTTPGFQGFMISMLPAVALALVLHASCSSGCPLTPGRVQLFFHCVGLRAVATAVVELITQRWAHSPVDHTDVTIVMNSEALYDICRRGTRA